MRRITLVAKAASARSPRPSSAPTRSGSGLGSSWSCSRARCLSPRRMASMPMKKAAAHLPLVRLAASSVSAATSSSPADILPSRNLAIGAGHSLEVLVADLLGQQAARIAPGADLRRVAPQERPQPRPEGRAAGQAWRRSRRPPGRTGRDRNGRGRDSRAPCAGRRARSSRPAPRRAGQAPSGSRRAACRPAPGRSPARNRPASAAARCRACAAPLRDRRRRPAPAACSTARAARLAGRTLPIWAMSFWLSVWRPTRLSW